MGYLQAFIFAICFILLSYKPLFAEDLGYLAVHDAHKCAEIFALYEKEYSIPSNLLAAVSLNESGMYHQELKEKIPWPWAVNNAGQGFYYSSKLQAIKSVKEMLKKGNRSIDVGCMQINLLHHPTAFKSLDEAFDPEINIAYAAKFLKRQYDRFHSWRKAVAAYHSENAEHGVPYANRVFATWQGDYDFDFNFSPENKFKKKLVGNSKGFKINNLPSKHFVEVKHEYPHFSAQAHKVKQENRSKFIDLSEKRRKSDVLIQVSDAGGVRNYRSRPIPLSKTQHKKEVESISKSAVAVYSEN